MDDTTLTIVAISAAGVALLALLLGLGAQIRLARVRRDFAALSGDGTTDIARVAATQNHRIDRLTTEVSALQDQVAGAQEDVRQSLRNVAVVRYDAFSDIGGRLSFSAAIVDDFGDGLVLSSIHARGESRTYAKGIVGGKSSVALTPEEQQALTSVATGQSGQSGHQGHSGQSGHQGHSDHSDHSDHQHRSKDAS